MSLNPFAKKIGILGGGQLGKMLYQAATPLNLDIHFLDQSVEYPVGKICPQFKEGNFKTYDDVIQFGKDKDVISIEIEAVNVEALRDLEKMGKDVYPQAEVIALIQDKGQQKQFFEDSNAPSSSFSIIESLEDLNEKLTEGTISFPFVQKLRRDGYDGRGVQVIRNQDDLKKAFDAPSVIEDLVNIKSEISVIVARQSDEDFAIYDPVEMLIDESANLLDRQIAPARIPIELAAEAKNLASQIAYELQIVGLLAVEMFIDTNDNLWINELAPRPHNSGHHTIEACQTSQYEQHLRCITGLPLGDTSLISQSLLMNVLGDVNHTGPVHYSGLEECMSIDGVHVHLYGKAITKPMRKMGHINILDPNLESAQQKYERIKSTLNVISYE